MRALAKVRRVVNELSESLELLDSFQDLWKER
jgi:hypothetical protein